VPTFSLDGCLAVLLRYGQAAEALAVADGAGPGLVGGHGRQTQDLHFLRDGQRISVGQATGKPNAKFRLEN